MTVILGGTAETRSPLLSIWSTAGSRVHNMSMVIAHYCHQAPDESEAASAAGSQRLLISLLMERSLA